MRYFDAHLHLDFFEQPSKTARNAAELGLGALACTVTPRGYNDVRRNLEEPGVSVALGMHPWWIADGRCGSDELDAMLALVAHARFIGEIGLDFSPKHAPEPSWQQQGRYLSAIAHSCAAASSYAAPKVLSLHSVRAAEAVLDILEETGCLKRCRCVFHWFSGTSDELYRAVRAGCWFSVNEMMLGTRRGREYARQIPSARLLTETDLPPEDGSKLSAADIVASLERTVQKLATLRNTPADELRSLVVGNAQNLLS